MTSHDAIAVSTRWAGSPLDEGRLRRLLDLGFGAIAIHGEVRGAELESILRFVPRRAVLAIHLFSPLPGPARLPAPPLRLASLHPEERRDARNGAFRTAEAAERCEAPVVVVPPAEIDVPDRPEVLELLEGKRTRPEAWERLRARRAAAAPRHLDAYRSLLGPLLEKADRRSLHVAIVPAGLPSELPDPAEVRACLAEFRGAPLLVWPDLLGDALHRKTGGAGGEALRDDLSSHVRGFLVEDGGGGRDGDPLGSGEVDLAAWAGLRETTPPGKEAGGDEAPSPPAALPVAAESLTLPERFRAALADPARRDRAWIVHLRPEAAEEDLVLTREALERFLRPPPPQDAFISLPG